jgi:hypothetical protein
MPLPPASPMRTARLPHIDMDHAELTSDRTEEGRQLIDRLEQESDIVNPEFPLLASRHAARGKKLRLLLGSNKVSLSKKNRCRPTGWELTECGL